MIYTVNMLKQEIYDFLSRRKIKLCALATVTESGKPHAAIMGYAVLPDLTIILSTDNTSRKWKNLKLTNHVALVFGWGFDELNVQFEGTAQLLEKGIEFEKAKKIYSSEHPEAAEFKDLPITVYLKIIPTWLRLSNYLVTPPRITEEKC